MIAIAALLGLILIVGGLFRASKGQEAATIEIELFNQSFSSTNVGFAMAFIGTSLVVGVSVSVLKFLGKLAKHEWNMAVSATEALGIAKTISPSRGGDIKQTRDLFQATTLQNNPELALLLALLPDGAMPAPVRRKVTGGNEVFSEGDETSHCISESLEKLKRKSSPKRPITVSDLMVDIAKYGTGTSVKNLRNHGVGPSEIDSFVERLGIDVLHRDQPEA